MHMYTIGVAIPVIAFAIFFIKMVHLDKKIKNIYFVLDYTFFGFLTYSMYYFIKNLII